MAERLTGKDIRNTTILKVDKDNMYIYNTTTEDGEEETVISCDAITKLGKFEDILEKYGIESFELLEHIIKKGKVINFIIEDFAKEEYDKMKQDRDTWKRACELACNKLVDYEWENKESTHSSQYWLDYFCQQAKKEKG